jgi:hypothetical protein
MLGISSVAAQLTVRQEGLSSVMLVTLEYYILAPYYMGEIYFRSASICIL